MNSDGEGDSRTATVGRKRQRGIEEQDAPTPADKRARTESEEEGEIDSSSSGSSHYSPSPEVHLEWDPRAADQSPQLATEFPHMSSANGQKASYATGLDGAGDDPPGAEEASNGTATSSASNSGTLLKPNQVKTIDRFERMRAEQIVKTPIPSPQEIKDTMAGAVVMMPMRSPKGDYCAPKKTAQTSFLKWIGRVAPAGLLGVYFKKNSPTDRPIFKALVLYRNQGYLDYLKKAVENKTPFCWDGSNFAPEMTLADNNLDITEFESNPGGNKHALFHPFAASLGWACKHLVQTGAMSLQDHDAYHRGAVLHPGEVDHKQRNFGYGYFGELAERNGTPLQVWALTDLSNGAATTRPAANGDHSSAEDAGVGPSQAESQATVGASSASANSTAANTPRVSGAAASDSAMSTAQTPQDMAAGERTILAHISEEEYELQVRYFGTKDPNDPVHCLTCGESGHMADVCPSRTCDFCQAVDLHFSSNCPTRLKCKKCRERGHKREECTAKLFRSKMDGIECDLCRSKDHFEEECTWVWRTFDPAQLPHINKIERLSVGCYFCGSDAHWGDDCHMKPRSATHPLFDVFSAKEANRYLIDPSARPVNGTSNGGISIKGSAQNNPIDLEDDDDDDHMANFYRNVRPPRGGGGHARGNIRMNVGGGNQCNQRRSRSPPGMRGGGSNYRQRNDNQFHHAGNGYHSLPPNPYGPPIPASRGGRGGGGGQVLGRGGGPPPPPPTAASSSRSRGSGHRKNRNKK
ncbi:hypothetical protein IWZ00DRAFT_136783 [Phyllosticta capitalensis]